MEEILINIKSPAWWFTGVFFILIGIVISRFIKDWLPKIIDYLSEKLPHLARGAIRSIKLKRLIKIRELLKDDVLVIREIIKNYIFLMLFLLSAFTLITTLMGTSIDLETSASLMKNDKREALFILTLIVSLPTYFFQILYMWQSIFLKSLLRHRAKMRLGSTIKCNTNNEHRRA